jgi:apolipoprotein N-acyltransferase
VPRQINSSTEYRVPSTRYWVLGTVSAILYILSFPNFNFSFLAWVALAPVVYLALQQPPKAAWWTGFLTGTAASMGLLFWVVVTFQAAHQTLFLAIPCWILLSAYLGLYWGAWTAWLSWIKGNPLLAAAAWAGLEYLRTHLFSGFPWALSGDSQGRQLPVIQIASITGVYGVSFLIAGINAAIASLFVKSANRRLKITSCAGMTALLIAALAFGYRRLSSPPEAHTPVRVALLQGSIDQYQKWDKTYERDIKKTYEGLAQQAADTRPELIVWPETSVPGYLLQDPPLRNWLTGVARKTGTYNIVGAPTFIERNSSYNSAFSLDPQGQILGQYDKTHLVPFGEWVPLAGFLGRWIHVLNDLGGFVPGKRSAVIPTHIGRAGVNICYEAVFPSVVRRSVRDGAEFIVNLTNDGWYMRTAAPYQHFIPNVFRAVENNRWVLRADNTGITALISPRGRIESESKIFVPAVIVGTIVPLTHLTFYTRYGDLWAWACLLLCIAFSWRAILRRP